MQNSKCKIPAERRGYTTGCGCFWIINPISKAGTKSGFLPKAATTVSSGVPLCGEIRNADSGVRNEAGTPQVVVGRLRPRKGLLQRRRRRCHPRSAERRYVAGCANQRKWLI